MFVKYSPSLVKCPEREINVTSSETGEVFCIFDADKVTVETVITMLYKVGVTEMKIITYRICGNTHTDIEVNKNLNDIFWFADNAIV